MRAHLARFACPGSAHNERQRNQENDDRRHGPKAVLEAQSGRLTLDDLVRHSCRFVSCSNRIESLRQEHSLET